jgi:membrane AbrB-like protein
MILQTIWNTLILFAIGACGWALFRAIRFPNPSYLGTVLVIAALRMAGVGLPPSPGFLTPVVQVVLGLYMGSKITRRTVCQLKKLTLPACIIVIWVLLVAFVVGFALHRLCGLDIQTGILASSMGGVAEMSLIAVSTGAKVDILIVIQFSRIILTMLAFPALLSKWLPDMKAKAEKEGEAGQAGSGDCLPDKLKTHLYRAGKFASERGWRMLLSFAVAIIGGELLDQLGVPSGIMVGAMLFTALASLAGMRVVAPSSRVFEFLLVGVGIAVSGRISPATLDALRSGNMIILILISNSLIFLSSFVVCYLVHKVTKWDYATSFMAAAPSGFTVMSLLAAKYNKNPFEISVLHLCRLVSLRLLIPPFFMFYE